MQLSRASALLSALALVSLSTVTVVACGDDGAGSPDAAPSPTCLEAQEHSDLAWIQEKIFTPSCANFSACHQGAASQAGGLSLEAGRSHAQLVGQASTRFPEWTLVVPNQPSMSYLMVVLGHIDGPLDPRVGTMPYNSALLCVEKREAIERWIAAGAPDTTEASVTPAATVR